MFDDNIMNC